MSAHSLSSAEKAAILLISLGEEVASEVFRRLPQSDVKKIGSALGRMSSVDQATVDIVLNEFLGLLNTKRSMLAKDGVAFARKAIELAFHNEKGSQLADTIEKNQASLRSLERADTEVLARILRNEHPQTIALVLAHTRPEQGAALLKFFPEGSRSELLLRVAQMEPVDPETILELDAHLSEEIDRMSSQQHRKVGGPQQVASILNHLHQDGQRILDGLGERQPQLAEDIRALMFTFEDLSRLDDRAIQELIKVIPRSTLTLALRGVPDNLSQLFYKNMSSRSAETMREDLIAMGAQKKEDVLRAQRDILDWVKKLEDQGKIVIERGERQVI